MDRKTLLLVDDSRTVLMQEQVILQRSYSLLVAQNGREAVAQAIAHRPDLVLMDVVMPEMDGLEACRAMRSDARTRELPIILVTTRGEEARRIAGFESGCTEYLTKPINPIDLLARIRECLGAPPVHVRPADAARARLLRQYQVVGSPPEEDFDRLAALAAQVCAVPMAAITFAEGERLWVKSLVGDSREEAALRAGSPCNRVIERSLPVTIADAAADPDFAGHPFVRAHGIRFYAGVPLIPPDAIAIGSLSVFDRTPHELGRAEATGLATVAKQIVTELEIRRQSIRDSETGVFNRRYMDETLEREIRRADRLQVPLGVALLAIEAKTPVSGSASWLGEIGSLLQARTRVDDVVCRYGPESFLVILPSASRDNTRRRADQLCAALDEALAVFQPNAEPRPRAAAAVASYPDDGRDGEALMRFAAQGLPGAA